MIERNRIVNDLNKCYIHYTLTVRRCNMNDMFIQWNGDCDKCTRIHTRGSYSAVDFT